MAKKETQPFNLLYRFEPQKAPIDKIYDFVVFQGRIIVMSVMLVVILAFAYRFPLDRKLNDQINLSNDNLKRLNTYSKDEQEKNYNDTYNRTVAVEKFLTIYKNVQAEVDKDTKDQVKLSDFLKIVRQINEASFKDSIVISDYNYVADPMTTDTLTLTGYTSAFPTAENFRGELVNQSQYVQTTKMQNLGGTKEGTIQFSLEVTLV